MFSGPDFLYVDAFFSGPHHLRHERAGADRRHPLDHVGAAQGPVGRAGRFARLRRDRAQLQLLHHRPDAAQPAHQQAERRASRPLPVPRPLRKDHPGREPVRRGQGRRGGRRRHPRRHPGRQDRLHRPRGEGADALLLPDRPVRQRGQALRVPQVLRAVRQGRRVHQERVLPAAQQQLRRRAGLPAGARRRRRAGRHRHSGALLQDDGLAASAVRPLPGADRRVSGHVPEGAERRFPKIQPAASGIRRRLPLAPAGIEPPARGAEPARAAWRRKPLARTKSSVEVSVLPARRSVCRAGSQAYLWSGRGT